MFKKQSLLLLTMVGLVVSMGGCALEPPSRVPPQTPDATQEPHSGPSAPAVGNLRGIVHDQEDPRLPIRAAHVAVGAVGTSTAAPRATEVEADVDNNKVVAFVMKVYGDDDPVLVERRKRARPGGPNWEDKYVYLKPGEFFLEGVPDGIATLSATYGGRTSEPTLVEVYKNNTRSDLKIPIFVPRTHSGSEIIRTVDIVSVKPETGLTASSPDEPAVLTIALQAPAGSAGNTIKGVRTQFSWYAAGKRQAGTAPAAQAQSLFVVAPARDLEPGPVARLSIPIQAFDIQQAFAQMDAAAQGEDGLNPLILTLHFIDENGFEVVDGVHNPLRVTTTIGRR